MSTSHIRRRGPFVGGEAIAVVGLLLCAATLREAAAQDPGAADSLPVLQALTGDWSGSGTLLGRSAAFTMSWRVDQSGFVHLAFSNAFEDEQGSRTPVLAARAVYRLDGEEGWGVWLDDRPQRVMIEAHATDSSFVSRWTTDSERGRTEYVVVSADRIVVRDFVVVEGTERLFGEAVYSRR